MAHRTRPSRFVDMASSSSSPSPSPSPSTPSVSLRNSGDEEERKQEILRKIRSHEVAIGELNHLHPSRAVYQKNGNIFFCKNIKAAIASEQKQLDFAKAQLQKLDAS